MEEWKEYRLGEICEILDSKRIPLSSGQREKKKGCYPYYGAQGIIDYIDDYIFDGTYLLVVEEDTEASVKRSTVQIWGKSSSKINNDSNGL